jgi:hypothetical protein
LNTRREQEKKCKDATDTNNLNAGNTISNNNQPLNAGMLVGKIEKPPQEVTQIEEPNLINKEQSKNC